MSFLGEADYDDLPENDEEAFVRLEQVSRSRLHASERDQDSDLLYDNIMRYMNEVAALAEQFAVSGVNYAPSEDYRPEFASFTRAVDYRIAQIRVQRARRNTRNSVALPGSSRERLQHHIERLKDEIFNSTLPEKRKKALFTKIAEFEKELAGKRFNLAVAMSVVALIVASAHDFQDTLINAPKAVAEIQRLIGAAAIEEDDQRQLLPVYEAPKALPDFTANAPKRPAPPPFESDLEDDVPF